MASRTRAAVAAFSFTGGAIGVAAYLLWRRSAALNLLPARVPNAADGNAEDEEEPDPCAICLEPPTEASIPRDWLWRAKRAIYGLDDGPVEWMTELHLICVDEGLVRFDSDVTVYALWTVARFSVENASSGVPFEVCAWENVCLWCARV